MKGVHWMNTYCANASFVMKNDDDVMINIYELVHFLPGIVQTQLNIIISSTILRILPARVNQTHPTVSDTSASPNRNTCGTRPIVPGWDTFFQIQQQYRYIRPQGNYLSSGLTMYTWDFVLNYQT